MIQTDVLIAGGGLVGGSLALALTGTGLDVTVVEAAPASTTQPASFDERHTALAPASRRFYEALGVWSGMAARASAINEIRVSDRGRFGFMRMRADEEGMSALGWVVPNHVIGGALNPALAGAEAVTCYQPATLTAVSPDSEGVTALVATDRGEVALRARLLIVAEGANSPTRQALGIEQQERSYGQSALVVRVSAERHHGGCAWERFTRDGPLAVLPAGEAVAVVWAMPAARAERMRTASDPDFLAALQEQFGYRLGRLTGLGQRSAYPLSALASSQVVGQRAVVVGNAAHTLHPVAGQGLNLSLRDIATLAEYIADARDADIGADEVLDRYARARRADYRRVFGFTDLMVRGFSNALPGVSAVRDASLLALDLTPPLRRQVIQRAMGRHGWLPRLMRGIPVTGEAA